MKATELMIGDWVIFEDKPLKVQHVYNNGFDDVVAEITEDSLNEYGVCEEIRDVRSINCSPILLTNEILEKNGWNHSNRLMITRIDDNDFYWSEELGGILYKNQYNMCNCKYVHNLQHALRLCGLDELADNFKI